MVTAPSAYFNQNLYIAAVDSKDAVVGKVERWKAHVNGVLHRAFTCVLTYKNQFILQHRKHPAFDGYFDLTFSSHQLYNAEHLQSDSDAILQSLNREWNLQGTDLKTELMFLGKIFYKAKDTGSIYTENEIDYIYKAELIKLPIPNYDYAYGFSLIKKKDLLRKQSSITRNFAPWVYKIVNIISSE